MKTSHVVAVVAVSVVVAVGGAALFLRGKSAPQPKPGQQRIGVPNGMAGPFNAIAGGGGGSTSADFANYAAAAQAGVGALSGLAGLFGSLGESEAADDSESYSYEE